MKNYSHFLKDVHFFRSLSDEDIVKIEAVCREEVFETGEVIFFEGTIGDRFFILIAGSVEIWKDYKSPDRDLLSVYRPTRSFGELSLIDHFPRSATVVASEPSRLLSIRWDDFNRVIEGSAAISVSIMKSMTAIIRERTENFVDNLRTGKRRLEIAYEHLKRETEERRQLEVQLRQAQKMESIGTLAGGIAHDFNNILFPIVGYAELTLRDLPRTSEHRTNIEEILRAANRAKDLVRQILTFSRQGEEERKPLKIQFIIKEALELLRSSLPATIQIRQNIDKTCGPVMADPGRIHQVIMNLGTNAFHAMQEKGGILEVNLKRVSIGSEEPPPFPDADPGPYLKLSVSDTGYGMNSEVRERIFDPYFTTKGRGKGTGLGLSIVHGIIRSHDGHISIHSAPGKGSAFHIYLPLIADDADTFQTEPEETIPRGHRERILLVEDELPIAQMLELMLKELGYRVNTRTSSIEALRAFLADPEGVDLVITDQTMPNMNGEDLAREIMRVRPEMPVILCTGFSEAITDKKLRAVGIRELVMKPVARGEMARIIRRVLESSQE